MVLKSKVVPYSINERCARC